MPHRGSARSADLERLRGSRATQAPENNNSSAASGSCPLISTLLLVTLVTWRPITFLQRGTPADAEVKRT